MTQRVTYTGPHRAVTVADGTVAPRGKHTEVDDQLADRLLTRDDFKRAPAPRPAKANPDPTDPTEQPAAGGDDQEH